MHTDRPLTAIGEVRFELRYRGWFDPGRGFTFPCDPQGCVELDRLSERARANYLFARATVGLDLATPVVLAVQ
ncbi:MAG: hypothetical protein H7Y61_02990 [Rhizobiales bacterium]|nr:hypothetical protein [Rhizobacter sp.]